MYNVKVNVLNNGSSRLQPDKRLNNCRFSAFEAGKSQNESEGKSGKAFSVLRLSHHRPSRAFP